MAQTGARLGPRGLGAERPPGRPDLTDTSGGLAGFDMQRRTLDGDFGSVALLPMGTAQWTDDTVAPETTYEYQVIAVLDDVPSEFNPTVMVTTPPAPPGGFGIARIAPRAVRLSWTDASTNAPFYFLSKSFLD
jgi:hypothetical protein